MLGHELPGMNAPAWLIRDKLSDINHGSGVAHEPHISDVRYCRTKVYPAR